MAKQIMTVTAATKNPMSAVTRRSSSRSMLRGVQYVKSSTSVWPFSVSMVAKNRSFHSFHASVDRTEGSVSRASTSRRVSAPVILPSLPRCGSPRDREGVQGRPA